MMNSSPVFNVSPGTTGQVDRIAYPFTSHWANLPTGRMHYVDEGDGELLLFVHGTPTWSFEWRHVVRAFSSTHRCIAPDHLGFGLSDRPLGFSYTPEAHAENLDHFIEQLNRDPFVLVVHDYGGPIGLPLYLRHPERIKRLVLLNTWMWSFIDDSDMERRARIVGGPIGRFLYGRANLSLRVMLPNAYGDKGKLTPEIHRQYLARFPDRWSREAVLWTLAKSLLDSSQYYDSLWEERAKLCERPVLLVWGMKDPAFTPKQLARWTEALPLARVVELGGVGHWPHEEVPERVILELRKFLAQDEVAD